MSDGNDPVLITMCIISKYYEPIILCFSILGNSLSLCVLFCTKLRYSSSSICLGVLATSDIVMSVIHFLNYFLIMGEQYKIITIHLQVLFWFISFWSIMFLAFELYLAIKFPRDRHFLRSTVMHSPKTKMILILQAILAIAYITLRFSVNNLFYNINIFFKIMTNYHDYNDTFNIMTNYHDLNDKFNIMTNYLDYNVKCNIMINYHDYNTTLEMIYKYANNNDILDVKFKHDLDDIIKYMYWERIYMMTTDINIFVLPLITISMFYILILYNMRKNQRKLGKFAAYSQISNYKKSRIKSLVIITSSFICCELPVMLCLFCLQYEYYTSDDYVFSIIVYISFWLSTTRYGMNFVLYFATEQKFRNEVIRMFTKRSNPYRTNDLEKNIYVINAIK